jgi:hypothetical protein
VHRVAGELLLARFLAVVGGQISGRSPGYCYHLFLARSILGSGLRASVAKTMRRAMR